MTILLSDTYTFSQFGLWSVCVCDLIEGSSVSKVHLQPFGILVQFRGIDCIPKESVVLTLLMRLLSGKDPKVKGNLGRETAVFAFLLYLIYDQ